MRLKPKSETASPSAIATLAILLLCTLGIGCSTNDLSSTEAAAASAYWKPHLLLTADNNYRKLHVEIDVVEGIKLEDSDLAAMKQLLQTHCRKPGGIKIVRDDVIPRSEAKENLARGLAMKHLDGPPDGQTAFLYLLLYDSSLSPDKKAKPVYLLSPYPGVILIDEHVFTDWAYRKSGFHRIALLHETAHAMGLTREAHHSDGLHCTNKDCYMNAEIKVSISKLLVGNESISQKTMCTDCRNDLSAYQRSPSASNLRYHGPWFVRSEKSYHVLTLPNAVYVHAGPLSALDEADLRELRSTAISELKKPSTTVYTSSAMGLATARRVAVALRNDPVKAVRELGKKIEGQLP